MDEVVEGAVKRVIDLMRENLSERITIDDMARAAMFSKFHFSRVFLRATGVSPGRFLSAMRLEAAKRLLRSTQLSVTDISHQVGYASVGTFSSRFRSCVGMAPSAYRRLGGVVSAGVDDIVDTAALHHTGLATISGRVFSSPSHLPEFVVIALFPGPIPQGLPVACTAIEGHGQYELTDVPAGTWYVLACSFSPAADDVIPAPRSAEDRGPYVGTYGPVEIASSADSPRADITLRPMTALDPPILLAVNAARSLSMSA
ncbi:MULTISPECIES: helix-turn-helix domain-containing protein [Actinoalloteichus]|uniref:Transcriptional regulator, AraC family n=1 Tax=Actinoalloteichus fjordicus TaxID=1612552 RepID=A0AAC9LES9_9PSEU|nr:MULTISPECIES: AraC family transcriptional regulator [Actinoalloteichus]APU15525.1 transcriptional regulator, AraC family [Actinoalloteichus fjordicus]APU21592.1 transcriptional regulator, AraC family [Actinoalloteichus sp. GBA129-24]